MRLKNIRPNFNELEMGTLTVYFSYETPIGFTDEFGNTVVRENDWGPTTGKHLNHIDDGDKEGRVSGEDFQKALSKILGEL